MKRTLRRILILAAVFLAAAGFLLFRTGNTRDEEVSYTVLGSSTLPVVSLPQRAFRSTRSPAICRR